MLPRKRKQTPPNILFSVTCFRFANRRRTRAANASEKFLDAMWRLYHPEMAISHLRRGLSGKERLWRIWILWGIPVGLAASALTIGAEFAREGGMHAGGALLDTIKVLIYAAWLVAAWRCAPNAENVLWRIVTHAAVALGVVLVAVTS
jgi:hypothetical protein